METAGLIRDIEQNFAALLNEPADAEVKPLINSIVRSIDRIKTKNSNCEDLLKIRYDLVQCEAAEEGFYKLQNPEANKIRYSESFFRSLIILRDELYKVLSKLAGRK